MVSQRINLALGGLSWSETQQRLTNLHVTLEGKSNAQGHDAVLTAAHAGDINNALQWMRLVAGCVVTLLNEDGSATGQDFMVPPGVVIPPLKKTMDPLSREEYFDVQTLLLHQHRGGIVTHHLGTDVVGVGGASPGDRMTYFFGRDNLGALRDTLILICALEGID